MRSISVFFATILAFAITLPGPKASASFAPEAPVSRFYSQAGREHEVKFTSVYRSELSSLADVTALTDERKATIVRRELLPLMDYVFGPLVNHAQGSPQRVKNVVVDWDSAQLVNGVVELPYTYRGLWIVSSDVSAAGALRLPVPVSRRAVFSKKWKRCTDSEPEHQTESFYWYFWDPSRGGCDQTEGVEYKTVVVEIGGQTRLTEKSFPEYDRMLSDGVMKMTMAFGYVSDPETFNPDTDGETGAYQYQDYLRQVRGAFAGKLTETPILQNEYKSSSNASLVIGHRFTGTLNGKQVILSVVMAAGVDQMEIFAKSFAHDHDDLFGWFGHSRVGSGFDAERFGMLVREDPSYYSINNEYQVIYWAGCNSYSYYTLPFFEFKGGTRNLDIIANGLPSFFSLNADNAMIATRSFLSWRSRPSYQSIVDAIEQRASQMGTTVLVGVLGDEDNQ